MSARASRRFARTAAALAIGLACTVPALAQATSAQSTPVQAAAAPAGSMPASLQPYYDSLLQEGEWGAVLNLQRLGLEAIDQGHLDIAARAFDGAISRIELIYADSDSAKKARSLWSSEGVKDFKGEPYERAMTYYYRGLLFMAEGDYENARASFRSGEYQDTISTDETYAGDFGMMSLLAGWASACAADPSMAADLYQRAATQQPEGLKAPPASHTTLLLVESGTSPVKIATGSYGEALKLQSGDNPFAAALANGKALPVLGDVGWQAGTLGGRQIDTILGGKATFRKGSDVVAGASGLGVQAALSMGTDNLNAAGALAVVGIAAVLVSSATKTRADTRSWDNLPDRIYGDFLKAGAKLPTVAEKTGDGELYPVAKPTIDATAGRCRVVVYRTREPGVLRAQAVSSLTDGERKALTKRNKDRDVSFRNEMQSLFAADGDTLAGAQ